MHQQFDEIILKNGQISDSNLNSVAETPNECMQLIKSEPDVIDVARIENESQHNEMTQMYHEFDQEILENDNSDNDFNSVNEKPENTNTMKVKEEVVEDNEEYMNITEPELCIADADGTNSITEPFQYEMFTVNSGLSKAMDAKNTNGDVLHMKEGM